jgi:hypothetical protein
MHEEFSSSSKCEHVEFMQCVHRALQKLATSAIICHPRKQAGLIGIYNHNTYCVSCYFPSFSCYARSHFSCKDKNAKLAEPLKYSDRFLRKYLLQRGTTRGEIWIGGMYNWQRHKWQWGKEASFTFYASESEMIFVNNFVCLFRLQRERHDLSIIQSNEARVNYISRSLSFIKSSRFVH